MSMALEPFFSLTPLNPRTYTYDPSKPDEPYVFAYMDSFGGVSRSDDPYRLASQHSNDELILGYDPVDPADQSILTTAVPIFRSNTIVLSFRGTNVSSENQYLMLFSLQKRGGTPIVQFFAGTTLVRSEELSGEEQVAILMDVPGDRASTFVYLRLASLNFHSMFGFKGMDCYLL
jgi:hypothetical protein